MIGVVFASGLQLSGAVQHAVGWMLIGLSVIGAVIYMLIDKHKEDEAGGKSLLARTSGVEGKHPPALAFINARDVEGFAVEGNVVKGVHFADLENASDVQLRGNVHDGDRDG